MRSWPTRTQTFVISCIVIMTALTAAMNACSPGFISASSLDFNSESYGGGHGKISISWAANHEGAINAAGGGYRVYYTQNSSIGTSTPFQDVPYVSGTTAPTNTQITGIIPGTYQIFVVGYSSFNKNGSLPSAVTSVVVP